MDTDRNLLFGVLALQADLLTAAQFAEACSAWAARKTTSLADLLVERGWLDPADRTDVEKLLQRKLTKHGGNAKASLSEVTTDRVRQSLAGLDDAEVRQSLAGLTPPPQGHVLFSTTAYVPTSSDRYTLSRLHATGGIGRVWLARDLGLGRDVALKELRPERADQPALWARFLREAQVTGQLEHPGIVPVYEVGRHPDEQPFYTMRFVRGRTFAEAAQAYHQRRSRGAAGRLELRELLSAFVGVCNAVAYAHSRGVLHRDLKPQNVVLGDYGEVIVLDWGLAKLTTAAEGEAADQAPVALGGEGSRDETVAGQVLGTPAYMAPEQAEGRLDLLDGRTDVHGLGAVLYEVLCGCPPFGGADTTAVLRQVVHEAPVPPRSVVPGTPPALEAVCLKTLAKRPAERYASVKELAQEVQRYLADEPVTAYRDPLATRLTRWGRRHRTLAATLAVTLIAVLAGLAVVLAVQTRANAELATKNAELDEQQAEAEARFELAQRAIATFHTGVSEDALLKNGDLAELRTKLLKEAAGFYADLERQLAGKADPKSRTLLAESYAQLGDLTEKIGDRKQALVVQQQALALRRELAAAGADAEARLEVAKGLGAVGRLLSDTGDLAGALAAHEEQRDIAAALEARAPGDAVRAQLAYGHNGTGQVLEQTGKLAEALAARERARDIQQRLAEANPAVTAFQQDLAQSHNNIGAVLHQTGKLAEALAAYERARDIRQKLVDADPAVTRFQQDLGRSHYNIGLVHYDTGKLAEALAAYERARDIRQKLVDANPAVTLFQQDLGRIHYNIGVVLYDTGKLTEALAAYERARDILQKLAEADPAVAKFQQDLAHSHNNIGAVLHQTGKLAEALAAWERARDILQKLVDANPTVPDYRSVLAWNRYYAGRLLTRLGRSAEGLAALDQARALCQALVDAQSADSSYRLRLGYSHAFRGAARARAGRTDAAAADLRHAIDLWVKVPNSEAEDHFERSRALAVLAGLAGDPKSGVTVAEAAACADQAVAALRDALQAGWSVPRELKEPDFDSLRKRDDFQKLHKEMEAKSKAPAP
jgi:tetratricopeptide (TPR) repeat protein/tRNA A-37 threonylcarbamoyl transferase component Bud32